MVILDTQNQSRGFPAQDGAKYIRHLTIVWYFILFCADI